MLYLDYTATTPIDEEVLETYIRIQKEFYANINSLHQLGQNSKYLFEKIHQEIKDLLGINHNLVFTGSAAEANNYAILGYVRKYPQGNIITTNIEHPSVYDVFLQLKQEGYDVRMLVVNQEGKIDLKQLEAFLDNNTLFLSIMWVNNIIGSIQQINEVLKMIKRYPRIKLHVDGVQGLCKIPNDFAFNDVDILTFSAHKIFGPKGIGLLAIKNNIELKNIMYGSLSQYNIRPGTISLASVAAFYKAIKKGYNLFQEHYNDVKEKKEYLQKRITQIPGIIINSPADASPYIFNISFPGINGETIVNYLSKEGIFVSTGSACSNKLRKPERTVLNITKSKELATSSIRISLSYKTEYDDLEKLIETLNKVKQYV